VGKLENVSLGHGVSLLCWSWVAAALLIFSLPFLLYRAITEDRILPVQLSGLQACSRSV
jgi:hypothetical protein